MTSRRRPTKDASKQNSSLTLEQFAGNLSRSFWDKPELLTWPPDVFALAASLLLKSGAYSRAVSGWDRDRPLAQWVKWIARIGRQWRDDLSSPPSKVRQWHQVLHSKTARTCPVLEITNHEKIYDALLHLCAAADEACAGVGFGMLSNDPFLQTTSGLLFISGEFSGAS
jgi:hypothetical protein